MNEDHGTPRDVEPLLAQSDWLRRLALGLVRDPHAADDIVQDAWIAALRRTPQADASELRAWLTVVVRNLARRRRRDAGLRSYHEPLGAREGAVPASEGIAARVELQRELAEALLALEEPLRSALVLRYFDDLSAVQVARKLGISHDNARQRISRGLAKLRARLDREHGSRGAWLAVVQPMLEGGGAPLDVAPGPLGGLLMATPLKLTALFAAAVLTLTLWATRSDGPLSVGPATLAQTDAASAPAGVGRSGANTTPSALDERTPVPADRATALVTDPPDGSAYLSGEVRDARGLPLPDAAVTALVFGDSGYRHLEGSLGSQRIAVDATRSDDQGWFRLEIGRRGVVQLEVDAGDRGACVFGERRAGEHVIATVPLPGSIRGRVVRAKDGEPIGGAIVSTSRAAPAKGEQDRPRIRLRRETVSDARGEYRIEALPPGRYEVAAALAGGGVVHSRSLEVSAGVAVESDLVVGELVRVHGTVRDAVTRLPIEGAEVATCAGFAHPVRSDAHGEYELLAAFEHLREIDARAPGYGVLDRNVERRDATQLAQVDLELHPGRRCKGVVRTTEGAPVAGAYVAAGTNQPRNWLRVDWRATETGSDGAFEIDDLRADMGHTVLVRKPGFGTRIYELPGAQAPGDVVDLGEIPLAPELEIAGMVRLESRVLLPGVQLVLRGSNRDRERWGASPGASLGTYLADRETRSDAAGRFSFGELSAGNYRLDAYLAGHNDPVSVTIALEEGNPSTDVIVPSGPRMAGVVQDAQGVGIPGLLVSIEPEAGDECGLDVPTDAHGRFEVREVPPGNYTLRVGPGGAVRDRPGERYFVRRSVQHVPAGKADIEIVLDEGDWVRGRVFESDGAEAGSYFVDALTAEGEICASVHCAGTAPFELGVRRGETYTIMARPGVYGRTLRGERGPDPDPTHAARVSGVAGGGVDLSIRLPPR